jgi:F0F1-type ATP synthase assembly protein I
MQFSAVIGVFAWAGWWLDGKLGSAPWLLIVGVFLGFLGGLISLVSKIPSSTKKSSATERSREHSR